MAEKDSVLGQGVAREQNSSATEESGKLFSVDWSGRVKPAAIATGDKDSMSLEGTVVVHMSSPRSEKSGDFFSGDWAERVQRTLSPTTEERGFAALAAPPLHVPKLLRSGNPSAYIPHFLSLGPYHYDSDKFKVKYSLGQHDGLIKISAKEAYKVKFAALVLPLRIDISAMIESILPEIESFYHWSIPEGDYSKKFALMMKVDSLFLIHFFFSPYDHGQHNIGIRCDILKLENQIPLSIVKRLFKVEEGVFPLSVIELIDSKTDLCRTKILMLPKAVMKLSPFDMVIEDTIAYNALDQPHLLGCIHAIVSPFLQIEIYSQKPTLPQRISRFLDDYVVEKVCSLFFWSPRSELPIKNYTAGELAKAGIKFKPFSRLSDKILFDKHSHSLYLPEMTLANVQTEVFFRNMVALEFVDTQRSDTVTRFIQLMHSLVHNGDDVEVLRKCHVISPRCLLSDEHIAGIWDSIRRPFSYGHVEPPRDLKEALDVVLNDKYYKIKVRMALWETSHHYYKQYFSTPWSLLAFVFALFLVFVNLVQAYCSLWGCTTFRTRVVRDFLESPLPQARSATLAEGVSGRRVHNWQRIGSAAKTTDWSCGG